MPALTTAQRDEAAQGGHAGFDPDLAGHEEVEEHPDGGQVLLDGRRRPPGADRCTQRSTTALILSRVWTRRFSRQVKNWVTARA